MSPREFQYAALHSKEPKSLVSLCNAPKPGPKDSKRVKPSSVFQKHMEKIEVAYLLCTKTYQKIVKFRSAVERPFSLGFLACPENS